MTTFNIAGGGLQCTNNASYFILLQCNISVKLSPKIIDFPMSMQPHCTNRRLLVETRPNPTAIIPTNRPQPHVSPRKQSKEMHDIILHAKSSCLTFYCCLTVLLPHSDDVCVHFSKRTWKNSTNTCSLAGTSHF